MSARRTTSTLLLTGAILVTGAGSALAAEGDGTFTMTLTADPGNLDPQMGASSSLFQATRFAYDSLLSMAPEDGSIQSQLATDWSVDGTTVTLTLAEGITCADGTPLTATDVVANFDYVADPANLSPFLGVYYPAGATAVADDAARTVTITRAAPAPFVLTGLTDLPIVCAAGLADRAALAGATAGTGPFVLSEAAPGDHYTYTIRDGYAWGPNGATTEGLPGTVVLRIVENPATAANLILTGDVNAATILGPDAQRVAAEVPYSVPTEALIGEMWFNHAEGRPGADPAVRLALTQGVDLAQLQQVLSGGQGGPAKTFATLSPVACPGESVSPALPAFDAAAAGAALDAAGWAQGADGIRAKDGQPLTVTFLHDTSAGAAGQAAAELATQQWTALGASVVDKATTGPATNEALFATGDWDIAWVPLNVSSPDQLVPFLSGPAPAEGGANFASVANDAYTASVTAAAALPGIEGCATWLEAESSLVAAADVVPFANSVVPTFGKGAEFAFSGSLIPTSIRLQAP
ncbi:MAG: ABC transporter substrate-binding protein [Candidatus Limnocylindrales bacterium]